MNNTTHATTALSLVPPQQMSARPQGTSVGIRSAGHTHEALTYASSSSYADPSSANVSRSSDNIESSLMKDPTSHQDIKSVKPFHNYSASNLLLRHPAPCHDYNYQSKYATVYQNLHSFQPSEFDGFYASQNPEFSILRKQHQPEPSGTIVRQHQSNVESLFENSKIIQQGLSLAQGNCRSLAVTSQRFFGDDVPQLLQKSLNEKTHTQQPPLSTSYSYQQQQNSITLSKNVYNDQIFQEKRRNIFQSMYGLNAHRIGCQDLLNSRSMSHSEAVGDNQVLNMEETTMQKSLTLESNQKEVTTNQSKKINSKAQSNSKKKNSSQLAKHVDANIQPEAQDIHSAVSKGNGKTKKSRAVKQLQPSTEDSPVMKTARLRKPRSAKSSNVQAKNATEQPHFVAESESMKQSLQPSTSLSSQESKSNEMELQRLIKQISDLPHPMTAHIRQPASRALQHAAVNPQQTTLGGELQDSTHPPAQQLAMNEDDTQQLQILRASLQRYIDNCLRSVSSETLNSSSSSVNSVNVPLKQETNSTQPLSSVDKLIEGSELYSGVPLNFQEFKQMLTKQSQNSSKGSDIAIRQLGIDKGYNNEATSADKNCEQWTTEVVTLENVSDDEEPDCDATQKEPCQDQVNSNQPSDDQSHHLNQEHLQLRQSQQLTQQLQQQIQINQLLKHLQSLQSVHTQDPLTQVLKKFVLPQAQPSLPLQQLTQLQQHLHFLHQQQLDKTVQQQLLQQLDPALLRQLKLLQQYQYPLQQRDSSCLMNEKQLSEQQQMKELRLNHLLQHPELSNPISKQQLTEQQQQAVVQLMQQQQDLGHLLPVLLEIISGIKQISSGLACNVSSGTLQSSSNQSGEGMAQQPLVAKSAGISEIEVKQLNVLKLIRELQQEEQNQSIELLPDNNATSQFVAQLLEKLRIPSVSGSSVLENSVDDQSSVFNTATVRLHGNKAVDRSAAHCEISVADSTTKIDLVSKRLEHRLSRLSEKVNDNDNMEGFSEIKSEIEDEKVIIAENVDSVSIEPTPLKIVSCMSLFGENMNDRGFDSIEGPSKKSAENKLKTIHHNLKAQLSDYEETDRACDGLKHTDSYTEVCTKQINSQASRKKNSNFDMPCIESDAMDYAGSDSDDVADDASLTNSDYEIDAPPKLNPVYADDSSSCASRSTDNIADGRLEEVTSSKRRRSSCASVEQEDYSSACNADDLKVERYRAKKTKFTENPVDNCGMSDKLSKENKITRSSERHVLTIETHFFESLLKEMTKQLSPKTSKSFSETVDKFFTDKRIEQVQEKNANGKMSTRERKRRDDSGETDSVHENEAEAAITSKNKIAKPDEKTKSLLVDLLMKINLSVKTSPSEVQVNKDGNDKKPTHSDDGLQKTASGMDDSASICSLNGNADVIRKASSDSRSAGLCSGKFDSRKRKRVAMMESLHKKRSFVNVHWLNLQRDSTGRFLANGKKSIDKAKSYLHHSKMKDKQQMRKVPKYNAGMKLMLKESKYFLGASAAEVIEDETESSQRERNLRRRNARVTYVEDSGSDDDIETKSSRLKYVKSNVQSNENWNSKKSSVLKKAVLTGEAINTANKTSQSGYSIDKQIVTEEKKKDVEHLEPNKNSEKEKEVKDLEINSNNESDKIVDAAIDKSGSINESSENQSFAIETSSKSHSGADIAESPMLPNLSLRDNVNRTIAAICRYMYVSDATLDVRVEWIALIGRADSKMDCQCVYCPVWKTSTPAIVIHMTEEHAQYLYALLAVSKAPTAPLYMYCRHCDFVALHTHAMFVHFQAYHAVKGILNAENTVENATTLTSDECKKKALSLQSEFTDAFTFMCVGCDYISNDINAVKSHCISEHPKTCSFNGYHVKLKQLCRPLNKPKEECTYRHVLKEGAKNSIREMYVCIACEDRVYCPYLAFVHVVAIHSTHELLFVCRHCEYNSLTATKMEQHIQKYHGSKTSSKECSVTLIKCLSKAANGVKVYEEFPVIFNCSSNKKCPSKTVHKIDKKINLNPVVKLVPSKAVK